MRVMLKCITSNTASVEVLPTETVDDLYYKIRHGENAPLLLVNTEPEEQRLIFGSKSRGLMELKCGTSVSEYGLQTNDTIHWVLKGDFPLDLGDDAYNPAIMREDTSMVSLLLRRLRHLRQCNKLDQQQARKLLRIGRSPSSPQHSELRNVFAAFRAMEADLLVEMLDIVPEPEFDDPTPAHTDKESEDNSRFLRDDRFIKDDLVRAAGGQISPAHLGTSFVVGLVFFVTFVLSMQRKSSSGLDAVLALLMFADTVLNILEPFDLRGYLGVGLDVFTKTLMFIQLYALFTPLLGGGGDNVTGNNSGSKNNLVTLFSITWLATGILRRSLSVPATMLDFVYPVLAAFSIATILH